jgi:integrase
VEIRRGRPWATLTEVPSKKGPRWEMRCSYPREDGGRTTPSRRRLGLVHVGRGQAPPGALTRKQAEALMYEWLRQAEEGRLPEQVRSGATVADAAERWLRYRKSRGAGLSPTTERTYVSALRRRILPALGHVPIEAVTTRVIEDWIDDQRGSGHYAPATVNKDRAILHGIFECVPRYWPGIAEVNPVKRVEPIHDPLAIPAVIPLEDLALILGNCDSEDWRLFFLADAVLGLRLGELIALRWSAIDFERGTVSVTENKPSDAPLKARKNGKALTTSLLPGLATEFLDLRRRSRCSGDDDLVFPNSVGRYRSQKTVRMAWGRAQQKAGVGPYRIKDLRSTCASLLQEVSTPMVSTIALGHSDVRVTRDRYIDGSVVPTAVAEAMGRAFSGLLGGESTA